MLLDSGQACPRCEDRQVDRRARRSTLAATVNGGGLPHASEVERRAEVDRHLHKQVTAWAWARELELERSVPGRAAAKARAEAAAPPVTAPAEPVAPVVVPVPRPAAGDGVQEQEFVLEDLTREQVRAWRVRAIKDHSVVLAQIGQYGRDVREEAVQPPAGR